jgi:integrase/recombinase XerD
MAATYLSREEFDRAVAVAETAEHRAILMLSYFGGLRSLEIARTRWEYVLDASGLVAHDLVLPNLATKGKTGGRTVPLVGELRDVLVAIHAYRGGPRQGFVFARPGSHGITSNAVRLALKKLYRQAGLRATSHSGRRSVITDLLRGGALVSDVQRVAGHASPSTTYRYVAPSDEMRAAMERR